MKKISLLLPLLPALLCISLLGCGPSYPTTPQGRLDKATKKLASAASEEEKFYALDDAAKESFVAGNIEAARNYAKDFLALAPKYRRDWNYGNAIQDGNLVLGRIALKEGRTEEAKQYLIETGKSPGSPQMNSFGPNVSLAKDLLEKGNAMWCSSILLCVGSSGR